MFCVKCGKDLADSSKYCPSCGASQEVPTNRETKKQGGRSFPFWFLLLLVIAAGGLAAGFYSSYSSMGGMGQAAEEQLQAIKSNQITKAYYGYTSKEFQSTTSLDTFKKYVKAHPALIQNNDAIFHARSMDEKIGTLEGVLKTKNGSKVPVTYQMVKEQDQWKILNIELGKGASAPKPSSSKGDEGIKQTIEGQLEAIRSGNLNKAYYDYTSEDFKQATPIDKFEVFVDAYPVLKSYSNTLFKDQEVRGDRASSVVFLESGEGAIPVEYKLIKEGNVWKVWSLHLLLLPANPGDTSSNDDSQLLLVPVNEQLDSIKQKEIQKAYDNVAAGFKTATTYDEFKDFVESFPAFFNSKVTIKKHYFDKGAGRVVVELDSDNGVSSLEYTLTKEDGKWKVWGLRIVETPPYSDPLTENDTARFDEAQLLDPIHQQLELIRESDYKKAYEDFTATAFRNATSQQQFDNFLDTYPVFTSNKDSKFENLTFENNIGIFTGLLTDSSGQSAPVEYALVKEKGVWKILSIKVLASKPETTQSLDPSKPLKFNKIAIGTEVDIGGTIVNPTEALPADTTDIYATIYIANGKSGEKIQVVFEHLPTGSQIPPVSTRLERNGDSSVSFVFTPPVTGWPAGEYSIHATSTSGAEQDFSFSVGK